MYYNGSNSYLSVNGTEIIKFKAKDSEIKAYPLCLGNISKDWSGDNMKKTGLKGYVYDFSVDYNGIAVPNILDIHKYFFFFFSFYLFYFISKKSASIDLKKKKERTKRNNYNIITLQHKK